MTDFYVRSSSGGVAPFVAEEAVALREIQRGQRTPSDEGCATKRLALVAHAIGAHVARPEFLGGSDHPFRTIMGLCEPNRVADSLPMVAAVALLTRRPALYLGTIDLRYMLDRELPRIAKRMVGEAAHPPRPERPQTAAVRLAALGILSSTDLRDIGDPPGATDFLADSLAFKVSDAKLDGAVQLVRQLRKRMQEVPSPHPATLQKTIITRGGHPKLEQFVQRAWHES